MAQAANGKEVTVVAHKEVRATKLSHRTSRLFLLPLDCRLMFGGAAKIGAATDFVDPKILGMIWLAASQVLI